MKLNESITNTIMERMDKKIKAEYKILKTKLENFKKERERLKTIYRFRGDRTRKHYQRINKHS